MWRFGLLVLIFAVTIAARAQTIDGTPADVAAIHKLIDGHAIGWNKGDAKFVAQLWHEDGDIRSADEGIIKGREAIQARYEKMFSTWAKGTTHSHPGPVTIRFLRPDVAIGDGFYEVQGIRAADGKEQPPEKGTWTVVFTKVNGTWGIASLR
jgi:uncharacterized protein (TIGR02246 family)